MVRPRSSLPFLKRNYLTRKIIGTVFVSHKTFLNTARKCVSYFALVLILKGSMGMNLQVNYDYDNMKCRLRKFPLIPLLLLYFTLVGKKYFTAKELIMHIVYMGLKFMRRM